MLTIIIFLIVLAVLIFVHELGHFLFAKAFGIRVDAFKIGFGPKIFAWTPKNKHGVKGETEYGLNLIPFGGYVKIFGENPDEEDKGIILASTPSFVAAEKTRSMAHKARWKQLIVLAGGVMFNIIFAWILYVGLFNYGVTPVKSIVADKFAVGIAMNNVALMKLPFFTAIYEGGHYTFETLKQTIVGLYDFFIKIFTGTANFAEISGPVGIAGIVGDAARLGFTYLLMITALISINLAVINFIPFPALDGGRILFVIIESIIRRRIPSKFTNIVNLVGFGLLMLLMLVITYKDVLKLVK